MRPSDKHDPLSQWLFRALGKRLKDLITGKGKMKGHCAWR